MWEIFYYELFCLYLYLIITKTETMKTQADVIRTEIRELEKELHHAAFTKDAFSQMAIYEKILEKQSLLSNIM